VESFNGKLRDELLDGEVSLAEAQRGYLAHASTSCRLLSGGP
jgi:hypothetical protein